MKLETYHAVTDEGTVNDHLIPDITRALRAINLTPLLADSFSTINKNLTSVGLPEFPPLVDEDEFEMFVDENATIALLLRSQSDDDNMSLARRRMMNSGVNSLVGIDLLIASSVNETGSDHQIISEAKSKIEELAGNPLSQHSLSELQLIQSLQHRFGDLSPNGKLLTQKEILEACRFLTDDDMRSTIAPIANAFGTSPTPRSGLEKLDTFNGNASLLEELLSNDYAVVSHYSVSCQNCGTSQLAFQNRIKAEEIISDAGQVCGSCSERTLGVVDTFALNGQLDQALRQGLWLESFVADVISPYTDALWSGQMAKNDEIDVLCIYAEHLILIECKDKNVGATDAYVTAAKAQNLGADLTLIVTTKEVHQNVSDVVQEMSSTSRDHRIDIIAEPSTDQIRSELESALTKTANLGLRKWMISGLGWPFYGLRPRPY